MLNFDEDASRLASDYVEKFKTSLDESQLRLDSKYAQIVLSEIESSIKFYCVKHSRKRNAESVEIADVTHVLNTRFGEPGRLLRHFFEPNLPRATLESLEFMEKVLLQSKKPRILDAGCGWGRWLKRLRNQRIKNLEMVGVDLKRFPLLYGKGINKAENFARSDVAALPFNAKTFDIVLCNLVIHEIKTRVGREKSIREFARVLKPKGVLFITDVFSNFSMLSLDTKLFTFASRILQYAPLLKVRKFELKLRKSQLERILLENSFETAHEKKIDSRPFSSQLVLISQKCGDELDIVNPQPDHLEVNLHAENH